MTFNYIKSGLSLFTLLILASVFEVNAQCASCTFNNAGSIDPKIGWQTRSVASTQAYSFPMQRGARYIFTFCSNGASVQNNWDTEIHLNNGVNGGTCYATGEDECSWLSEIDYTPNFSATTWLQLSTWQSNCPAENGVIAYRRQLLQCVTNPTPSSGATGVCNSMVNLSWNSTNHLQEASYLIYLNTSGKSTQVYSTNSTNIDVSGLTPNTLYTWTVTLVMSNGDTNRCADWTFTTSSSTGPTANISQPGGILHACPSQKIKLYANPSGGNASDTNDYTHQWLDGSANLSSTNTPTSFYTAPASNGNYMVVYRTTDQSGCFYIDTVNIEVGPLIVDAGSDKNTCPGLPVSIGGAPTSKGGKGGYSYAWLPNDRINDPTIANPRVDPFNTTDYTVTVTDAEGCTGQDIMRLTPDPYPNVDAGGDKFTCYGDSAAIGGTPTATGGNGGYTYQWFSSAYIKNNTASNTKSFALSDYKVNLLVTDVLGCINYDSLEVTVNPDLFADAGGHENICLGTGEAIGGSPTGSGGTPTYTYTWTGGLGLNNYSAANPIANPSIETKYIVKVTDFNNCFAYDTILVRVIQPLTVDAGPDDSICQGLSTQIGGSPSGQGGDLPLSYSWTPTSFLSNASDPNPIANPSATRNYTLTVSDTNNCSASDIMTIFVSTSYPKADAGSNQATCGANPVVLGGSPSASFGTPPYTYNWSPSLNIDDPQSPNPTHSGGGSVTYTLTVNDAFQCEHQDFATVLVTPSEVTRFKGLNGIGYCEDDQGPIQLIGTPVDAIYSGPGITQSLANTNRGYSGNYVPIPDNDINGVTIPLNVSGILGDTLGLTSKIRTICLEISHTYVGNLKAELENPNGQKVILFDRPNHPSVVGGCPGNDIQVCIDTGANNSLENVCTGGQPTITGNYTAHGGQDIDMLNDGSNPNGTWKLHLYDLAPNEVGQLVTFNLEFKQALANFTPSNAGVGMHTITITYPDPNCLGKQNQSIEVWSLPVVDAGVDTIICQGGVARLGGKPTASGYNPFSYEWKATPTILLLNQSNPTSQPNEPTTYEVIVTDYNGCTNNDFKEVSVLTVNAGLDKEMCYLGGVQIGGAPTIRGGQGPFSISWAPSAIVSDPSIENPIALASQDTTYTVTVIDALGCVHSDEVFVQVNPLPVVDAGVDTSMCLNSTETLGGKPTATAGTPPFSYSWSPGRGVSNTALSNPDITSISSTIYTVTVADIKGCIQTDSFELETLELPIAHAGNNFTKCKVGDALLGGVPAATKGKTPYSYFWEPNISLNSSTAEHPKTSTQTKITYTLTVIDENKCKDKDEVIIDITKLQASAGPDRAVCLGQDRTIGGSPTGMNGVPPYSYTWIPNVDLSSSTSANPKVSPTSDRFYTLEVSDANGCKTTDTVLISIAPNPVAQAGGNRTICQNASDTIGGSPTGTGGSGTLNYFWSPNNFINNPTLANPIVTGPNSTITYTLLVSDSIGCFSTDEITISSAPGLTVNAGLDLKTCENKSIKIGSSQPSTNGQPPFTYLWTPASGLNNPSAVQPTASPSASTYYTLTVKDKFGCLGTDSVQLDVLPIPVASAGSDATICSGIPVTIGGSPSGSGGTGNLQYRWKPSIGLNDTNKANPEASVAQQTLYTLTVIDDNGCTDNDIVEVFISQKPIIDAGTNQVVCAGEAVYLGSNPTVISGNAPYTFQWSPSNSLTDPSISNPQFLADYSTVFNLKVIDAKGCEENDFVEITVLSSPSASAGSDKKICTGEDIVIGGNPTGQGGNGILSYSWSPSSGLNNANVPNPETSINQSTVYTVTVRDENLCSHEDEILVEVFAIPLSTFNYQDTGLIVNFINNSQNASTWYWDFGDGSISSASDPSHTYVKGGTYKVCLTSSNQANCENKSCRFVTVAPNLGLESSIESNPLKIYPNPGRDKVYLETDKLTNQFYEYSIFTIAGEEILSKSGYSSHPILIFDATTLSSGLYLIELRVNNSIQLEKLFIQ